MEPNEDIQEYPEMPPRGHVQEATREWLVRTDAELAKRLQNEEVTRHLSENKERNTVVRTDFPTAAAMQTEILERARNRAMALKEQADMDAAFAAELQKSERACKGKKIRPIPENTTRLDLVERSFESLNMSVEGAHGIMNNDNKKMLYQNDEFHDTSGDVARASTQNDELSDRELALKLQKREYDRYRKSKEKSRSKKLVTKEKNNETLLSEYSQPCDYLEENDYAVPSTILRDPPPPPRTTGRPRLPEPGDE